MYIRLLLSIVLYIHIPSHAVRSGGIPFVGLELLIGRQANRIQTSSISGCGGHRDIVIGWSAHAGPSRLSVHRGLAFSIGLVINRDCQKDRLGTAFVDRNLKGLQSGCEAITIVALLSAQ